MLNSNVVSVQGFFSGISNQVKNYFSPQEESKLLKSDYLNDPLKIIFMTAKENLCNFALVNKKWASVADSEELRELMYIAGAFGTERFMTIWPHINPGKQPPFPHCVHRDYVEGDHLTFITDEVVITYDDGSSRKEKFDLNLMGELVVSAKSEFKGKHTNFTCKHEDVRKISPSGKKYWSHIKQNPLGHGPEVTGVITLIQTVCHGSQHSKLAKKQGRGADISGLISTAFTMLTEFFETGKCGLGSVCVKEKVDECDIFMRIDSGHLYINKSQGFSNAVGFAVERRSNGVPNTNLKAIQTTNQSSL